MAAITNDMSDSTAHIHLGKAIQHRLDEIGMAKAEFGRRIGTSRQNVNSLLNKKTMDTGLLARIGEVLGHDFFAMLSQQKPHPLAKGLSPKSMALVIHLHGLCGELMGTHLDSGGDEFHREVRSHLARFIYAGTFNPVWPESLTAKEKVRT